MFNQKKKIKILGKEYFIDFPLPGQVLEIESLKNLLTAGQYGIMAKTNTVETNYILDLVDAISTFSVLIPEMKEVLPKKSYLELPLEKAKEFIISYRRDYENWYISIRKDMMTITKDDIKSEDGEDGKEGRE